jgi:histone H3/H4
MKQSSKIKVKGAEPKARAVKIQKKVKQVKKEVKKVQKLATIQSRNEAKKAFAVPLDRCKGMRTGSFERLLRFCNHLCFGPESTVRIHGDVKRRIQEAVEHRMGAIIDSAMLRRTENERKTLMAVNVVNAFNEWATIIKPEATLSYLELYKMSALFTPEMREQEYSARKDAAIRKKYGAWLTSNIEGLNADGVRHRMEYPEKMKPSERKRFAELVGTSSSK